MFIDKESGVFLGLGPEQWLILALEFFVGSVVVVSILALLLVPVKFLPIGLAVPLILVVLLSYREARK